jgi:hypothetical protein
MKSPAASRSPFAVDAGLGQSMTNEAAPQTGEM